MSNSSSQESSYLIPLRYRKMENLHIVFWLFKDVAWCMFWKPLGILMIIPTLIISVVIAWRTRMYVSELCHNLAISVWISANSYWMVSEFLHFDAKPLFGVYTYKHLAIIPFVIGIGILAYYYLYYKLTNKEEPSFT
ncbi:MAG: hypothetical protein ACOVNY_06140 [Chitinophagaceae bacterium]